MMKNQRADLFTYSKQLQGLMLSAFHTQLNLERQHLIDRIREQALYGFIELPRKSLLRYLDSIDDQLDNVEYEVRDSTSGSYLRIRKYNMIIDDEEFIKAEIKRNLGL